MKPQEITEELTYLMNFNQSITFTFAMTMNIASIALARFDSYLYHLKSGIKHDTLAALITAPIHLGSSQLRTRSLNMMTSIIPDSLTVLVSPLCSLSIKSTEDTSRKSGQPAWKMLSSRGHNRRGRGKASNYSQ